MIWILVQVPERQPTKLTGGFVGTVGTKEKSIDVFIREYMEIPKGHL